MQAEREDHSLRSPSSRVVLGAAMAVLCVACQPDPRCTDDLYYNEGSCNACPEGSLFEDDTCVCDDATLHFEGGECLLPDGGTPTETADDDGLDAGAAVGGDPACADYCSFIDGCIADNALAVSVAPMTAEGLSGSCAQDCAASTEPDDPVIACISAGREAAMCDGSQELGGVLAALGLVDECCLEHDGSSLCAAICETVESDPLVGPMVMACQ